MPVALVYPIHTFSCFMAGYVFSTNVGPYGLSEWELFSIAQPSELGSEESVSEEDTKRRMRKTTGKEASSSRKKDAKGRR